MIRVTEPTLVYRPEQFYVGIRRQFRMAELVSMSPPLADRVLAWLDQNGLEPAGAPFWRYLIVDMERKLEIDIGIPIAERVPGEGSIITGTLMAGTYAMMLHTGHHNELEVATASLLAWAEENGIRWKTDGSRWEGRVEWYYSNPEIEPDLTKWETELAFLTDQS